MFMIGLLKRLLGSEKKKETMPVWKILEGLADQTYVDMITKDISRPHLYDAMMQSRLNVEEVEQIKAYHCLYVMERKLGRYNKTEYYKLATLGLIGVNGRVRKTLLNRAIQQKS